MLESDRLVVVLVVIADDVVLEVEHGFFKQAQLSARYGLRITFRCRA